MKYFLFSALVTLFVAGPASATGLKKTVYDCRGGAGEYAASVNVVHLQGAAPGGPVWHQYHAIATHSWLAGTHSTDDTLVTPVIAADGGPENYLNKETGFFLTIHRAETDRAGHVRRIDVSGDFVDAKNGMQFSISRRWMPCR